MQFLAFFFWHTIVVVLYSASELSTAKALEEIPPECRITLAPLLRIVNGTRSRNLANKEFRTLQSRQTNLIEFLIKIKIGNNPTLHGYTQETRNIIMACYTANLVSGENILCETLKSGTISRYLSAASELSTLSNVINPCLDVTGKQSKHIKDIINEVKRWESIPDRREPVTNDIIDYIFKKGLKLKRLTLIIYTQP